MEPERLAQVLAEIVESGRLPATFPQLDPLVVKGLRSIFHNTKPSPLCPRTPCPNPADTVFHYFNNAGKTTLLQPVFDCKSCKRKFVMNGRLRMAPSKHHRRPRAPAHRDCSTSSSTSAAGCKRMEVKGPASKVSISQYGCQSWMMADKAGQPASGTSLISGSKRPMADHERPQQLVKRPAPMHYASYPNSGAAIRCNQVMQHNSAPANNIFVVSSPTNHLVQNPCLLLPHGSDPQNNELASDRGLSSEDTFAADLESQLLLASSSSPTCGHPLLLQEQEQAYCEYGQQPAVNYQQEQAEQDVFWELMKELQEAAQLPTVSTTATSTTTTNCTAGDDAHWFKAATIGTTAIDHDDNGRLMSEEVVGGCDPVLQENDEADVQCEFRQPQDNHQQTPYLTKQYTEVQAEQDILILQYMQKELQEAAEFSTTMTMTNCTGAGDADADWLEASMGTTTVDVEKLLAEFGDSEDHLPLCGEELWGCLDHLDLPPGLEELCTAAF